jgi:hypothetical protein
MVPPSPSANYAFVHFPSKHYRTRANLLIATTPVTLLPITGAILMLALLACYLFGFFAGLLVGAFSVIGLWLPAYVSLSFCINLPPEGQSVAMRLFQRFTGVFFACALGASAVYLAILTAELPGALFGYAITLIGFFYSSAIDWLKK